MLTDLLQLQWGTETTWGTPVAPTVRLHGVRMKPDIIKAAIEAEVMEEQISRLGPSAEADLLAHSGAAAWDNAGIYEDINYPLESMFGTATPSGAGPYVRAGTAPVAVGASPTTPRKATLYHGDAVGGLRLSGGLVTGLTFKAESKKRAEYAVSMIGEGVDAGTPATLSNRDINPILGAHGSIYVDAWDGTIGTTALPGAGYAVELALGSPRELKTYLGSVIPTDWNERKLTGVLKMTLEWNATTDDYFTGILSQSAIWNRQIRLSFTDGTRIMQFNFAGVALEAPVWNDRNGIVTFDVTLTAQYNAALSNWFTYSNTCGVAALA